MRLSRREAEQRAIDLAEAFLAQQDAKGWSWRCMGAKPDLLASDNKHRKIYIKWTVSFDVRPAGSTFDDGSTWDGPLVFRVNIATETVSNG